MHHPIVGILGGMGPAATADLLHKIIAATPADARPGSSACRHLGRSDRAGPLDRAPARRGGPDTWLVRGAQKLAEMGASFIAVPCNTAHAFLPRIAGDISVPFLHMMEETATAIEVAYPAIERVGLLATSGTIAVGSIRRRSRAIISRSSCRTTTCRNDA